MLRGFIVVFLALILVACAVTEPRLSEAVDAAPQSSSAVAFAAACSRWDNWDKPAPPFRVFGDTYHVGTCGITSLLIVGDQGHLVIDAGTEAGAEIVAANIESLGFSLSDVRYLSHTQEHFDHVGGMARLQQLTGARMVASERARSVFETGVSAIDDPQYGLHDPIAPLTVDSIIEDGAAIRLGDKRIVATYTPGHSPGAISWRWSECESDQCLMLVLSDGLGPVSAPDYRWGDHPNYLADYRASIDWLIAVEADICLSVHPSQMRLIDRIKADALIDSTVCRSAGVAINNRLNSVLTVEQSGQGASE